MQKASRSSETIRRIFSVFEEKDTIKVIISRKKKSAHNGSIQKKKTHKTRRIKQATPMNTHPVQTIVPTVQPPPTSPLTRPTPSTTNTTLPSDV